MHCGSHGKGGWLYQLLALFLTYTSIVSTWVPMIVRTWGGESPELSGAGLYIVAFIFSYAMPFLMGFENIIGLLIMAFGLWEAWKINKRSDDELTGPFSVTAAAAPAPNV